MTVCISSLQQPAYRMKTANISVTGKHTLYWDSSFSWPHVFTQNDSNIQTCVFGISCLIFG